jgi:hypothetical protein
VGLASSRERRDPCAAFNRAPAGFHGWRTAYGCGRSGDELHECTARAGARRRVRDVAADARVLRGRAPAWWALAPVTVSDDAGATYGESKESEGDMTSSGRESSWAPLSNL